MYFKASFFLMLVLVLTLGQPAVAQLPQTLDEMKQNFLSGTAQMLDELRQGNYTGVEQHFATLQTLLGVLGEGLEDQASVVMDVGRVGSSFNVYAYETLGIIVSDLQESLIENESIWKSDEKIGELVAGELAKIGDVVGLMLIAGLQNKDVQVQLRSIFVIGILLGGQVNFQDLSLEFVSGGFQNLFSLSPERQTQFLQQFVLLKENPELAKWIEVLEKEYDKSTPKLMHWYPHPCRSFLAKILPTNVYLSSQIA